MTAAPAKNGHVSKEDVIAALTPHSVETIYQRIGVQRHTGAGGTWRKCQSPFRDDSPVNPSFNFNLETGGWRDHATDETGDIFNAVMHGENCSFPQAVATVAEIVGVTPARARTRTGETIVATYQYRDERGRILSETVKYHPKRFSQRRPRPGGGWINNLQDVRRVPYRLPELLQAVTDDPTIDILFLEGEKDVDRAIAEGFVATTNAMGAKNWHDDLTRYFADLHVVAIPDNDPAGHSHVRKVAAKLHGTAETYKISTLPDLANKGDFSDWFDAGGTADELRRLIAQTPEWRPEPAATNNGRTSASVEELTETKGMTRHDFWRIQHAGEYLFIPTRQLWPKSSVAAEIGPLATAWVDANRRVHQLTWAPGEPMMIHDRLMDGGGWIDRPGAVTFNLYRPGTLEPGDASAAAPWIEHVCRVYPDDATHIIHWLAQRVQRPGEKINHALVLGGAQGIGKDTILAPVMRAVGPWNVADVSPVQLQGRFNGFVKSVILRVSEARDLGEFDRFKFYEHLKTYTAAPPEVLRVDEKNVKEYDVPNVTGVIITTNHKSDGIYLPADDRRHYVAWSERTASDFTPEYWRDLYAWYEAGGYGHVLAYLLNEDLTSFDPKAPPPKTAAFWEIVDAGRAPEDNELADALEGLHYPDATTLESIASIAGGTDPDFATWLRERKNRRQIPHRLESAGYVPVRNPDTTDGRWKYNGRNQVIYARRNIGGERERITAARRLAGR